MGYAEELASICSLTVIYIITWKDLRNLRFVIDERLEKNLFSTSYLAKKKSIRIYHSHHTGKTIILKTPQTYQGED